MFWFWMMMRNPPECPPLKFEGSGSAQDNFLPSMDIHGALYVHCTGPVHCTSVCALSDIFQWKFTAHSSVHWISALFSLHALLLHCRAKVHALIFSAAEHCNSTLDDSSSLNGGRRGNHAKQTKSQGIIIATFLVLILLIRVFCSCYIMSSSILQWGWWWWKPTMGYVKKPRAASVTCPHYVCSHPWQCIDGHDDDDDDDDGHDVHSCHDDRDDTE